MSGTNSNDELQQNLREAWKIVSGAMLEDAIKLGDDTNSSVLDQIRLVSDQFHVAVQANDRTNSYVLAARACYWLAIAEYQNIIPSTDVEHALVDVFAYLKVDNDEADLAIVFDLAVILYYMQAMWPLTDAESNTIVTLYLGLHRAYNSVFNPEPDYG